VKLREALVILDVTRATVEEVAPLRELHRQEMACQIVHDSFPARGLSDPYLLHIDGRIAGYGLVANRYPPDAIDEFYVSPAHRAEALPLFRRLIEVSHASRVRAQTNDRLLTLMLYDCASNITSDTILFADAFTSALTCQTAAVRPTAEADRPRIFEHQGEPVGDWLIESDGVIVATGGALYHYNPPYADIYMEVAEPHRRRGFGSYLVQEMKRICYEMGKVPAARCNVANVASRRTLEKAGLLPCARILHGEIA
jgi:GNAT superfamily N-acetyltransferase